MEKIDLKNVMVLGKGQIILSQGTIRLKNTEKNSKPFISFNIPINSELNNKIGERVEGDVERENVATLIFDNIEAIETIEKLCLKCKEKFKKEE